MKLSQLLATRHIFNRRANLANLAYAFKTLKQLSDRLALARITGRVRLRQADVSEELYWASLTALEGSQSVIEEHFDDEDIMGLADAIDYALQGEFTEIEFSLEQMESTFVAPLRALLDQSGVTVDIEDIKPADRSDQ